MEVEGKSIPKSRIVKTPAARNKTLGKFKEKKANKRKRLRKSLEQRKALKMLSEENAGKDWKLILREKFEQISQTSGHTLAFGLSRLFKEENRSLVSRVVEQLGDQTSLALAQEAMETFLQGGINRTDGSGPRTMGGVFFRVVKDKLEQENPMKLKAIFIKSDEAKKRKGQIRKARKQANKQTQQLGSRLMSTGSEKKNDNPFANVFSSLV